MGFFFKNDLIVELLLGFNKVLTKIYITHV